MATYKYGTYQKKTSGAGGASFRAFLAYTASETDSTYSLTLFAGLQCNASGDIGTSGFSISVTGTGQTTKSKTGQTYYTSQADSSQRKTLISTWTWTWDKADTDQSKTVKCTVSASSMSASTATYTFTVPALAVSTYTISYNANGGSGAPNSQIKTQGQSITLSSIIPIWIGYDFKNWNTQSNGTGTTYLPEATYSADADVVLYAQWQVTEQPVDDSHQINKIKLTNTNITYNLTPSNISTGNCFGVASESNYSNGCYYITAPGFYLANGGIISIYYEDMYTQYINVNNTGTKTIYYRGNSVIDGIVDTGDCVTMVYDGTSFHIISIDKDRNVKNYKNYYEAGDYIQFGLYRGNCLLTNGRQDIRFSIPVDKPIVCNLNAELYPGAEKVVGYDVYEFGQFYIRRYGDADIVTGASTNAVTNAAFAQTTSTNMISPSHLTFWWRKTGSNVWTTTTSYNNKQLGIYLNGGEVELLGVKDVG